MKINKDTFVNLFVTVLSILIIPFLVVSLLFKLMAYVFPWIFRCTGLQADKMSKLNEHLKNLLNFLDNPFNDY